MPKRTRDLTRIGWREWVALPELGISLIKAKVDTGARTSALHTFYLEPYHDRGTPMVQFRVHPLQQRAEPVIECHAPVADRRRVTDSGGHSESRYVITTPVCLGSRQWPIEVTLTNRDTMRFRLLLGRTALRNHFMIDAGTSYVFGYPEP